MSIRPTRTAALVVASLLVALVVTGCGRRALPPAAPDQGSSIPTAATTRPSPDPVATPTDLPPEQSAPPPEQSAPPTSLEPIVAPELGSIQALLDQLDAALGADATADSDEGSWQ